MHCGFMQGRVQSFKLKPLHLRTYCAMSRKLTLSEYTPCSFEIPDYCQLTNWSNIPALVGPYVMMTSKRLFCKSW